MNKTIPKIMMGLTAVFIAGILISGNIGLVSAGGEVPNWFKGVAGFWAEDKISTDEFVDGIEFLLSQGIIKVPSVPPEILERGIAIADEQAEIGFGYDTFGIQRKIADLKDELAQAVLVYNSAQSNVSNKMADLKDELSRLEEKSSTSVERQYRESDYDFMVRTGVISASQILAELEAAIDRLMEQEGIFYFNTSQKLADLEKEIAVTEEAQEVAMKMYVKLGSIYGSSTED